ncbi:MAG TPA: adenylate/guanylate cyclase domain-containing protein [Burkholderiales bacterium]|nr:adenylate/guanylate cyclase domain-containing protein [Burkholderiales bacterium]
MARDIKNLAVLFVDVCESTKLYSVLGDNTARTLINDCLSFVSGVVVRQGGRVVKTIGDEVLSVFSTADAAILAASEIQSNLSARRSNKNPVCVHAGLHFGPVLVEEGDVFGDTVNAAAYLTAVAAAEQVLTTQMTQANLSPVLKDRVRPVFKTVLKGAVEESTVFQVIWHQDTVALTDVNMGLHKIIPGDEGSLLIAHRELTLRLDQRRPGITIGRSKECDLVIHEKFASRRHTDIRLMRTHFYLIDQSINGTFVMFDSGEEVHVLRGELLLDASGKMSLGRSLRDGATEIIHFSRDRRSLYRV